MWKPIKGYENRYEVSDDGQVRNVNTKQIKSQRIDKAGYYCVTFGQKDKRTVHRLVAQAFIENSDNLPCVNHKDENKLNNNVSNLEWCTVAYNNCYGTVLSRAAISRGKQISAIQNGDIVFRFNSLKEASETTGADVTGIGRCARGRQAHSGGYQWQYAL